MTDEQATNGGEGPDEQPVVMIVDDNKQVVEVFDIYLRDEYRTLTATGGEEALEKVDESVDVVLLDRRMPRLSGDEVLDRIREAGYGCRVAMVTAVDPDFDIVEMPFDDYIEKPVDEEELRSVVERLIRIARYDGRSNELYAVTQKRTSLEAEKPQGQLDESEEFARLVERQRELESEIDEIIAGMDDDDIRRLFQGIESAVER